MSDGLKAQHRAAIIATLAANDRVERAVLFGSRAMGTNTITSDVDIALFGDRLTLTDQAHLATTCDGLPMAQSVDLVLHNTIDNPALVDHIRTHGVEWYRRGGAFKSIDDVCLSITSGGTPSRRNSSFYKDGSWPWIKTKELQDGWLSNSEEHITDEAIALSSAKVLPKHTVLMAMYGATVGQLGILQCPMTCNQACCAMILDPDLANYRYLFYRLLHARPRIKSLATGAAQQNLNSQVVKSLEFNFPPLPEQKSIAYILGTLDDKIELNRRMNETLEAMARAIFKDWFVDFGPVRAKVEGREAYLPEDVWGLFPDSFQESELGEIPRGWEIATLGTVAAHPRRSVHPAEITPETPYIALEHIPKKSIVLPNWETSYSLASNKFQFNCGEILFGKLRPYFHKVGIAPVDGICSTDIVVMVPQAPHWFGFVLGHTSSTEFINYTDASSTGTRMPRTSWKDMAGYELILPPEPVAAAFTESIQSMIDRLVIGIHESRTLSALRDALLSRLVSGKLCVKTPEKLVRRTV